MVLMDLMTMAQVPPRAFCALRGTVEYFNGTPAESVPVKLLDHSRKLVSQTTTAGGTFEFCDFGFGEHSIEVGEGCGTTLITGVRLVYDQTQRFRVVFNFCLGEHVSGTGCRMYIRVVDGKRQPIGGVRIPMSWRSDIVSDVYGRMAIGVSMGRSASITLQKEGYKTHVVETRCLGKDSEIEVQLEEVPK